MRRETFPFWRFSLRAFGREGVAKACVALQDECSVDVNLLLYCCWIGGSGRVLDRRAIRSAATAVARWQADVVAPLRLARRAIRKDARDANARGLRRRIAAAELDAEYVEQRVLAASARRLPASFREHELREAMAANLRVYMTALPGTTTTPRHARHVATIVDACCTMAESMRRSAR